MGLGLRYLESLGKSKGGYTLDGIRAVLKLVDNPQDRFKTIHVAGTNGKGSVSAFIASMLGAAGYRVGLTISPHLTTLNERILLDGVAISDSEIDAVLKELKILSESSGVILSYHEALTAAAFLFFHFKEVDWGVIEVGLGGRLDASNVIARPEVAVITSIGLDHQDLLGNTLYSIALEKAGIIKDGADVVVGEMSEEAWEAITEKAQHRSVKLYRAKRDFSSVDLGENKVRYRSREGLEIVYSPSLLGAHQIANSGVAVKVAELIGLPESAIKAGASGVFWPGRLEEIEFAGKVVLLDGAHNTDGANALVTYLASQKIKRTPIVFGALNTKDWREMLKEVSEYASEIIIAEPPSDLAVSAESIEKELSGTGIRTRSFGKDYLKIIKYISMLEANRLIIFGSLYLLGALRPHMVNSVAPIWVRGDVSK